MRTLLAVCGVSTQGILYKSELRQLCSTTLESYPDPICPTPHPDPSLVGVQGGSKTPLECAVDRPVGGGGSPSGGVAGGPDGGLDRGLDRGLEEFSERRGGREGVAGGSGVEKGSEGGVKEECSSVLGGDETSGPVERGDDAVGSGVCSRVGPSEAGGSGRGGGGAGGEESDAEEGCEVDLGALVEAAKRKGNDAFRQGDFTRAASQYSVSASSLLGPQSGIKSYVSLPSAGNLKGIIYLRWHPDTRQYSEVPGCFDKGNSCT